MPRSSALLHWPSPPLWRSWIFGEFPVRQTLNPFCSACPLTLRSRLRILALLAFSKRVPPLPKVRQDCLLLFVSLDMSRQVPCRSAGASFFLQRFLKCPVLKFWRTLIAFLRCTLLPDSLRWTLSFPIFYVAHRALGELDGVIRSQFSNFPKDRFSRRAIFGHTTQLIRFLQLILLTPSVKQLIICRHPPASVCLN